MEEKRERRRRDLARMKDRVVRIYGRTDYYHNQWARSTGEEEMDPRRHHVLANHIKSCSCWMCGNPRRYFKGHERITMQERKFLSEESE